MSKTKEACEVMRCRTGKPLRSVMVKGRNWTLCSHHAEIAERTELSRKLTTKV